MARVCNTWAKEDKINNNLNVNISTVRLKPSTPGCLVEKERLIFTLIQICPYHIAVIIVRVSVDGGVLADSVPCPNYYFE